VILKKLILENFRQFKGKQNIEFAEGGNSKYSPCITVLYGENGRGKTGIYRALMFGLYGESKLSQDENAKASELSLVNRHLLELHPEEEIKATVDVEFTHNNSLYRIYREITGVKKKSGEILQQPGEAQLRKQDGNGNTSIFEDPLEIRQQIDAILDFRVREYFLFDGEKIERLTRANPEQRKEVSAGIRNLLNLDDLEKSIIAADKLCRKLDQDVKKKSSGELQQVIQEINLQEDTLKKYQDDIASIGIELKQLEREKRDTDSKLDQYQEISGLVKERKEIERQKDECCNRLDMMDLYCRQKSSHVALGIIRPTLQAVFDSIEARREKGDIPPLLRSDLIQQLLETHTCICGRELSEGTEPFQKILEWMSKTPKTNETDAALQIWKHLDATLREIPEKNRDATNHLMQHSDIKDKLRQLNARLEMIAKQIGTNERADAAELEKIREKLEQKQIKLCAQQVDYQSNSAKIQSALDDLGRKRQLLENDASIRDSLIKRSQMARQVKDVLKEVFESFKIEAAKVISQNATEIMERLLDEEGRRTLKGIVVEDNYSLQIADQWDGKFLANISAGQRQIMSIAFITALAKVASGNKVLEMPLFMDTPFGRLSQEHRNNLIREIPNLSSQWVLLATDTELRREEGQVLLDEKRLGKFYRLTPQSDGTTSICEYGMQDVPVLLKASMEKR
jgi:DNA sulfur modification protein DndD